ncbi:uncharacterized protein LOC142564648 isoform X3 [Dermacentor variabilis]|uniref:uncharacterized protein LOC142564648 isoform X3 n=1 Tax=Dermacentor variabilis TaxID=34621 RepID=UPI003F5B22D6
MGRPRIVRSPEEQAAFNERRRALARERARRRRADPAVRAARAQAMRKQREEDPERREREAEASRRRRAANPELRKREAERKRQRRVVDPEYRERDVQAKRQRRANDPEYRARESERLQQRRLGLPQAARTSADSGGEPTTKRFERQFLARTFGTSCTVCDWFDNTVTLVTGIRSPEQRDNAFKVLREHYPKNALQVCSTCKDAVTRGVLPAYSTVNGTDDKDLQRPLHSLAQELYSNQKAQEGKVDCWLQTDGTGKIDCFVQTEDAVKSASEVPTEKCMKVVAVQTEECPELQFYEPTCDATQYESECPSAVGTESEDWL